MGTLNIKHTPVFERNWNEVNDESIRFIVNQGGSRSSKTYSICQMMVVYCLTNPKKLVSIVRKSFPSLRATVMRDFFEVLKDLEIYDSSYHNKSEQIYHFTNGSSVEFFSVDDEQKLRGRKRDILWANEANELDFEEFNQLNMRTSNKLIFDFNPSDNEHWLYDLILRDNAILIKSTYLDNPFLSQDIVDEIENLMAVDENYYKIYALGEKPIPVSRIYNHFNQFTLLPSNVDNVVWGLDFGYNHPTCLLRVSEVDSNYYVDEIIYKQFLTSGDIVKLFNELGVSKKDYIYADYSRPEIIQDLRRAGYNMKEAVKEVKPGIDSVKSHKIFVSQTSTNIWKEYRMYNWKSNGNQILDEPIKLWDDAMDALRYAIHSSQKKKHNKGAVNIYTPKRPSLDDEW